MLSVILLDVPVKIFVAMASPLRACSRHNMKTLGLLGGMTYHATLLYYAQINATVQARLGGSHSAKLILHSFDHQEMGELFNSGQWDKAGEILVKAAINLKKSGADATMICVNTAHKVADQIEAATGLPFLHIIDFTGQAIVERRLKRVALLGTAPVMEQDFIKGRLARKYDLEVLVPSETDRKAINDVIFGDLGKKLVTDETKKLFLDVVADMVREGAEGIVLACTELQFVLKPDEVSVPLFDTVELHAKGAAEWALDS